MTVKKATKKAVKKAVKPDGDEVNRPEPPKKTTSLKGRPKRPGLAKVFEPDMSRLTPLTEMDDYLRMVLYGHQGIGKTTLVAGMANRGKVVVVDPEGSFKRKALQRQGVNTDNLLMWPDWDFDSLQQMYHTVKAQLEDDPGSIFGVMIDTGSALAHFWLEETVRFELSRPAMQKRNPDRTQFDVFQEDYGTLAEKFKVLITRQLYTLPCHVVTVCHSRDFEDETGAVRIGPDLSPAARSSLLTYSDWVLRMTMDRHGTRKVDCRPGRYEAKDRYGLLPVEGLENPDMDALLTYYEDL